MTRQSRAITCVLLVASALLGHATRASAQPRPPAPAPARKIDPPKLVKFVDAEFPESEKASGKGAAVLLQIAISETGAVSQVAVVQSASAAFDAAAVAAAKQFVFEPARADGKAIPVRITYRYEFVWKDEFVQKKTADFEGVVRDGATKKPIANATIVLDSGQTTTTDAQGKFSIPDVAPGDHEVTIKAAGFPTVVTKELFEIAKKLDATYEIRPDKPKGRAKPGEDDEEEEIVVTAPRIVKQTVSTEVKTEQARRVPGTQGDVLKVVENLPGVARAAVGSGALVVWGASPEDTRVYLEGMRIPRLYHDGGYRSVIHSDFVRSVELVPGGYGAAYGRGLGGLVTIGLRPLDEPGVHGSAAVDVIDASLSARAKVTDRLHVAIAGRRSHLDSVVSGVTSTDVADVVPIPRYYDGQARLVYDLGPRETFEVGGLMSSDSIDHALLSSDPSLTKRETRTLKFWRVYARYENKLNDGSVITVVPSYGADASRLANRFGAVPTALDVDSSIFGLRASWRGQRESWLGVSVGLDAEMNASQLRRAGSIGSPPREGDVRVFGQSPSDQINVDAWKTSFASFAPFAEADVGLLEDRLHVIPGIRFEPFVVNGSRLTPIAGETPQIGYSHEDTVIEPRLAVRFAVTPRISVKAAFGVYHQPPASQDLSAVFGTPTLGLSIAKHYVTGGAVKLTRTLALELTGFLSRSEDLVTRSRSESPELAHALVQDGRGRSYGTQLLLRQEQLGRFFGWISYSIMKSERSDAPGANFRLFDYDQTHVLTALGSYDLGLGFEIGTRIRFASGFPRTPVTGAYFDARTDSYQPFFGAHNSVRIPSFFSIDVRLAKRFRFGGKVEGEVYLDVQNVTNHKNPEELVYNASFSQRDTITGLPILPVIGARLSW